MPCRDGNENLIVEETIKTMLFPNPAKEKVTITFSLMGEQSYTLDVFDILGMKVLTEGGISKAGINNHEINIHSLSKGVYIVSLSSASGSEKLKLEVK